MPRGLAPRPAISWGDDPSKDNANCNGCGSQWDVKQTAPVGQFKPNPFGLYDMHGNVFEWVEDVWHNNYEGVPKDGSAWLRGGDPSRRAVRGGSWFLNPQDLRAASRFRNSSSSRLIFLGFRVGRTLTLNSFLYIFTSWVQGGALVATELRGERIYCDGQFKTHGRRA